MWNKIKKIVSDESGYSMTELMIVLVIIGILALIAIPSFLNVTTRARHTEAKEQLRLIKTYQDAFYYEYSRYASNIGELGYQQSTLASPENPDRGANYRIDIEQSSAEDFVATATAVVDFDNDGSFNIWEIRKDGVVRERVPD